MTLQPPAATAPRPWVMRMTWRELLFAHWRLAPDVIQRRLPAGVTVDRFDNAAWLGIVPFRMTGIRPRGLPGFLPGLPTTAAFTELNVRTYVRVNGRPGVWFFSLDAPHRLPVAVARRAYHLNYQLAAMRTWREDGWIAYRSMRRRGDAGYVGRHRPIGAAATPDPGTLAEFLTARYRMFMVDRRGRLRQADVRHASWRVSEAQAEIELNTMARPLGLELSARPDHMLFADVMATRVTAPRFVESPPPARRPLSAWFRL